MRKTAKSMAGIVSGVTLAIGSATAASPTPVNLENSQITANKPRQHTAVTIKNNAKPGNKLMDYNLANKPGSTLKIKENIRPGKEFSMKSDKVGNNPRTKMQLKENSKPGQEIIASTSRSTR